jgi:hypothetical protein
MDRELVIEAGRTEGQYWRDLFRYRELFYFLARRTTISSDGLCRDVAMAGFLWFNLVSTFLRSALAAASCRRKWRLLYSLNPMVGVIDGFRWAVSGGRLAIYLPGVCLTLVVMTLLLASGILYFRRMERTFADVI